MTEPVSTTIGGFSLAALIKQFGMAIMIILCVAMVSAVVFMTRMPRSPQEWAVGLICTIVSSLAGGSFVIMKWSLHSWATDIYGVMAIGGVYFICGLPGWAVVRWITTYISESEGKNIVEVIREFRKFKQERDHDA